MSATDLLNDLARRNIRLEAAGNRLRFYPRSAVTAELAEQMKAQKAELIALLESKGKEPSASSLDWLDTVEIVPYGALADWFESLPTLDSGADLSPKADSTPGCPRCGCQRTRDFPIHAGQSTRRECARCRRFVSFPIWNGKDTGHNDQHRI